MSTLFEIKLPKPVYPETRTLLRLTGFGGVNTHEHATRPIAAWIVRINHRRLASKMSLTAVLVSEDMLGQGLV